MTPFDRFVWNRPKESQVSPLAVGQTIGFLIAIPDYDIAPQRWQSQHVLAGAAFQFSDHFIQSYDFSDDFAVGILLDPGGEIPDDSAVESITWGRIKAQFVK